MSSTVAIARSPIAQVPPVTTLRGWEVSQRSSRSDLTISDQTPQAKVHIRAPKNGLAAKAIDVSFGRAERSDSGELVIGAGPGEWLVLGAVGRGPDLTSQWDGALSQAADSAERVTVLDTTHGRALIRIYGTACKQLLAKVCAIDLSDAATPNGAALRTSVAKLVTDVVRDDQGGETSFLLHCERSSGQYLFDSLLDAGNEFGIEPQGFVEGV